MIGPVPCPMCGGIINKDLQALCGRAICISCATAIAAAIPLLKTQPSRRHAICMRLQENGIRISPADKRIAELVEYGVTDEQITGACDMAKQSIGNPNLGYVLAILRNERERVKKPAPVVEEVKPEPVKSKEEWERQGFANQADYEACQFAFDQAKRRGRRDLKWPEHKQQWMGVV